MATYLFAWNPNNWPWESLPRALEQIAATGRTSEWGSCKAHRIVRPGDRAFLVKLGVEPKGIMASGFVTTEPFLAPHWGNKSKMVKRVDIEFDALIDPHGGELLSLDNLRQPPMGAQLWTPQASGISIAPEAAVELERLWYEHLSGVYRTEVVASLNGPPHGLLEGRVTQGFARHYERSPHARRICVEHYGSSCTVCGIDFGVAYGELGAGFIHVHHLVPLSQSGAAQQVDPIRDLRPVCPNCHAMLHRTSPPLSVEALRRMLG